MPARKGDWKSLGSVEVTQFQRKVCKYAEKRSGGSKPCDTKSCHDSPETILASTSFSHSTSSSCPCASSSRHAHRTSEASPGCGGGTMPSTRYCLERTLTIWPACGTINVSSV